MKEEKERVILDGNAFYELDLECVRAKEQKAREEQERSEGRAERPRAQGSGLARRRQH